MRHELREGDVTARGIRFHYGAQGEGPLVLLLHGFPERWFSWRPQLAALADAGFRAVAVDLRGYGESDKPAHGYTLPELAQDVASLVPALGADAAAVVGHDWGGAITWEVAWRHPDRVARFAALNGPHPAVMLRGAFASPAQLLRSWYMLFFQLPWLPERALSRGRGAGVADAFRRYTHDAGAFTADELRALAESASTPEAVRPMLAYYRRVVRDLVIDPAARRRFAEYGVIERPGMLVWSDRDRALGTELVAPHLRYARDLRVVQLTDCGHFVPRERAGAVSDLLVSWLSERPTRW